MAPVSVAADGYSASHFLPGCKTAASKPDARNEINIRAAYCLGFVAGLGTTSACIPSDVTNQQAVRVVVNYLEARANRLHERFSLLALSLSPFPSEAGAYGCSSPPSKVVQL
jgi:hypothetical protein